MAKPAQVPRWATGAGASVVEPTEVQKDNGWSPGQKPPAQYWNWWRRAVSEWLNYLDGLTNEALTWAARHTFNGGVTVPTPVDATDAANKAYVDAMKSAPAISVAVLIEGTNVAGAEIQYFKDQFGVVHVWGEAIATSAGVINFAMGAGFGPYGLGVGKSIRVGSVAPFFNVDNAGNVGLTGGIANGQYPVCFSYYGGV